MQYKLTDNPSYNLWIEKYLLNQYLRYGAMPLSTFNELEPWMQNYIWRTMLDYKARLAQQQKV